MLSLFKNNELLNKNNLFFQKVYIETQNISKYFNEKIIEFPKLFNENYTTLDEALNYLKQISLPNKYVCANYIKEIPGWTCKECSKYTDSIFCHDCYKQSKEIHKNHHLYFLPNSGGMCGCGEPEALYNFCPEHSGPHINKKQINDYISTIFEKKILDNLNSFFNIFFQKFSYYFILTEKCEDFCPEIFKKKFNNINENNISDIIKEKKDIMLLKNNFAIVYQNLLHFLRLITENNLGMLYLIANYFLENHFNNNNNVNEEYKTCHRCIIYDIDKIEIIYEKENVAHICQCPFFTIFLSNWRDDIENNDYENQKFLLSFTKNFPLKHAFGVIYFCINKQIFLNDNSNIIGNRIQFILDYTTAILAEKTNIIEETYELFYEYFSKNIKSSTAKDEYGTIKKNIFENLIDRARNMEIDCELYSMPITRKLMSDKLSLIKRVIDCLCLIHNENEFKSISPHPVFQGKGSSDDLINLELKLLGLIECINMFTDWKKLENMKEIFKYLINKIINQKSEGIKQLKENEYSFHPCLYRCFGLLINYFCFYYSFNNKCSLFESIQFFMKTFFESENQLVKFIEIILHDYYKLFGFLSGIKNGFFNYYESMSYYIRFYIIDERLLKTDFTLLKYIFIMTKNDINLDDFLKISNIENTYSFFKKLFLEHKIKIIKNNNNISSDDLLNILNNSYNIFPQAIDYGDNLEILRNLQEQYETQVNSNIIQQYINNLDKRKEKLIDDFNNIMHIKFILELIIILIKDDTSPFNNLMRFFRHTSSTKTKSELFDEVKINKNAMIDLENILKEELVQEFTSKGNLEHLDKIKENIDDYLYDIFDEKYFTNILDELTMNKINKNEKLFFLKDSSFKYLDMSYYYSFIDKSKAQRYIIDFKKDFVKSYNTYFYKPSDLMFEFYEKIYEKILLNKNNLEIIIKIIERLLVNEGTKEEIIIKSIRNSFLPIVFKYLSIFGCINTKSFIEFKIKNEELINKINKILNNSILNKDSNKIIDKDFEENINEVINQLNRYKIINNYIKNDFSKLNKYDYNSEFIEKINESNNISNNKIILDNNNNNNNNKLNSKTKKFKSLIKNKNNMFLDKIKSNKDMLNEINNQIQNDINNNNEDETMCFFCRNQIKLNSFDVPYGKGGYYFEDYFYWNSVNTSIKSELLKLNCEHNDEYLNSFLNQNKNSANLSKKIISCGHYFHFSCFSKKNSLYFSCPLCLKKQNILIPPLINFHDTFSFLQPYKLEQLFNNEEIEYEIENEFNLFVDILNEFLSYNFSSKIGVSYIFQAIPIFQSYFNYLENIFYYEGTNFHKQQQIEINKNLILSLRYMTKAKIIDIQEIIININQDLLSLVIGPKENENIINNYENMYYTNIFEKMLLYLSVLFDYDEIKELLLCIIYIFLPYFSFGFYLRELLVQNKFYSFYEENMKEKININNLKQYFEEHNKQMTDCFKLLLQKLSIIKLITDYKNKNDEIINSFNKLNIENLLLILNMDNFNNLLQKNDENEIKFANIFEILSQTTNIKEKFNGILGNNFDYNQIFDMLINNIKNTKYEKYIINKQIMAQFSPIKFKFIKLDKNFFDFVESYLEKECILCLKKSRFYYICLICGNKICHTNNCNKYFNHSTNCGGKYCILIDMNTTNISISGNYGKIKELSSLYINKEGIGPKSRSIGREYNLSKAKEEIFFRNFICYDFHFN